MRKKYNYNDEEKLIRADKKFVEILRNSAIARIENRVDRKMRRDRELTKMIQNCPSFNKAIKELSTIPKVEDVK